MKSAELMIPSEVLRARERLSCAFIPVSPMVEWHSHHLPLATDGLIVEAICKHAAETLGGIYFRTLSFGLDRFRTDAECAAWGLEPKDKVFGMNFPKVSLKSEYCQEPEMYAGVKNRVKLVRNCGFKAAIIVNHHGGAGQNELLAKLAAACRTETFLVEAVSTTAFARYKHPGLTVGGHAGLAETHCLMAFFPELIDMTQMPEGELEVSSAGILHNKPVIEAQFNPRNAQKSVADEYRKDLLSNFEQYVREKMKR